MGEAAGWVVEVGRMHDDCASDGAAMDAAYRRAVAVRQRIKGGFIDALAAIREADRYNDAGRCDLARAHIQTAIDVLTCALQDAS